MSTEIMAKAVAVQGALKIVDPEIRALVEDHHKSLESECDSPGEVTSVLMMDSLSYAAATCRSEARAELRAILKSLVDVIFDTAEERFPNTPVVLH